MNQREQNPRDCHEGPEFAEIAALPPPRQPLVRRKGRVYIINKTNRRFKARQG